MQNNPDQYSVVHEVDQEYTEKHDEITVIADTPEKQIQMYSAEKQRVSKLDDDEDFIANKIIHSERNNHGAVEINESEDDEQDEEELEQNILAEVPTQETNVRSSVIKPSFVNEIPLNLNSANPIFLAGNLAKTININFILANYLLILVFYFSLKINC